VWVIHTFLQNQIGLGWIRPKGWYNSKRKNQTQKMKILPKAGLPKDTQGGGDIMMKHAGFFTLKALTVAMAMAQASPALATNGYFLPGAGFRSQSMGGVGIAYGRDSLSIAANPANIVNTGMRGDMGFGVFDPERYAATGRSAGQDSPFGFNPESESNSKYYIIPEMGMTMPLSETLYVGFAAVGAGLGTNYPTNFYKITIGTTNHQPIDEKIGIEMMQLQMPLTVGYKINETHSVGAALVLAETRFRAYGLGAFKAFDLDQPVGFGFPISADPDHLTNQGFDYSYGAGVKLGWQGDFMDDKVTLGLTYSSRTYMTKFDKYRGLFAEQGDFDIPENYGIGIAFKPKKNLVIAADIVRINYADIPSIGNRGPGTSATPYPGDCDIDCNANAVFGIPSVADPTYELGNDQGMGFGWENQTVYKLGVQYGVNNRLQVRAGLNYGKSPIPDDQLTFNTLAPATVEWHYSVGFTYKPFDELEVTGTYMYVAPNTQHSPPAQNVVGQAEIGMHQNLFALSLGWVLDPGPVALGEYGEGDWDGINFDGGYAGLGFGQSNYRDIDATSANTRTEGWKVYAGYQLNKYLGVEGGYANLNDMTATTGNVITEVDSDAWTLAGVVSYPLTDKFSVMGKVGGAYILADFRTKVGAAPAVTTGDDSFVPNYGAGVSYALLDNLNLRAEWERFDRDGMDIDLMTAGLAMKF
jgi:long-chain fatty acid transport protein